MPSRLPMACAICMSPSALPQVRSIPPVICEVMIPCS